MNESLRDLRPWLWIGCAATTIHNLEEAIGLPRWSVNAGVFHPPVEPVPFWVTLGIFTSTYVVVTWMASSRGGGWLTAAVGASGMMLLNVLFPHVLATLVLGRYAPGVITALAVNVPVHSYVLWRAIRSGLLVARTAAIATVVAGLLTVLSIFALLHMSAGLGVET